MTTNSFGTAMPHLGYTQPKCAPFRCPKVATRMNAATSIITAAGAGLVAYGATPKPPRRDSLGQQCYAASASGGQGSQGGYLSDLPGGGQTYTGSRK
ncbi:hypothetical protein MN608_06710 [Microdochium nivale]|nr:hypothetical protein MN608_06710 [Microdochium nivale]